MHHFLGKFIKRKKIEILNSADDAVAIWQYFMQYPHASISKRIFGYGQVVLLGRKSSNVTSKITCKTGTSSYLDPLLNVVEKYQMKRETSSANFRRRSSS